jgi:TPR repeat protein
LKDYRQALNWCEKSAELNSTSGQVLVAELYYFGYGIEQDFATAAHFYRLAAVQQHQHAQVMVFLINNVYNAEQSTNAEKVDGLLMLELAKEAGYAKAQQIYEEVYVK